LTRKFRHHDCCDCCNTCGSCGSSCGGCGTGTAAPAGEQIGAPKDAKKMPEKKAQLIPQPSSSSGLIIEQ
jgi:hypothetical protein